MDLLMQGVEYFHKGGLVMYILLICSIFIITIGIERLLYFMKADSGRAFAQNFYKSVSYTHLTLPTNSLV